MGGTEEVVAVKPLTVQERIEQSRKFAQQSTSQLAADKGLETPPVTAVGTGTIGGTPQQQAMAGTPAQKKGALAAAVAAPAGETGLEQAMKVKPQAALDTAKAKQMDRFSASLGTFGDKVNQWIEGVVSTTTSAQAPKAKLEFVEQAATQVDTAIGGLPADKQAGAKAAMDLLKTQGSAGNEAGMRDAIFQLNSLLGKTTTEALLEKAGYGQLWKSVEETTAGQLEAGVQQQARGADAKLTLQDITNLGTSPAEIATLLGIPENQVGQLSLGDFQQQLQRVGQSQFGETQQVSANIASALVSQTEREALRGTMRELEESGIAGVEAQFQQLVKDIEQGSVIEVGGKTYSVEEFLKEGTISSIAEQYFNGDKDLADKLAAEEPQLKQWLDSNRSGLIALIAAGGGKAEELKTHNQAEDAARKAIDSVPGLADLLNLKDPTYKPGYVLQVGQKVDWSKGGPAVQGILTMNPAQQPTALANLGSTLTSAQRHGLDPAELKNANPELFLDSELVAEYNGKAAQYGMAQQTLKSNDPVAILNSVLTNDTDLESIQDILDQDAYLVGIGQEPSQWWSVTGGDGRLDPADAKAIAKSSIRPPTLAGAAKGDTFGLDSVNLPSNPPPILGALSSFSNQFWANDKKVDSGEILASYDRGTTTLSEMLGWYEAMKRPGPNDPSPVKRALQEAYSKARDKEVAKEYEAVGVGPNGLPAGALDAINNAVAAFSSPPYKLDAFKEIESVVRNSIANITKLISKEKNPDMVWRYQQDIAAAQNAMSQAYAQASAQRATNQESSKSNKVSDVEEAFTDIATGVGDIVRDTAVTPTEKATEYVGSRVKGTLKKWRK